jgi:hypothetical protein
LHERLTGKTNATRTTTTTTTTTITTTTTNVTISPPRKYEVKRKDARKSPVEKAVKSMVQAAREENGEASVAAKNTETRLAAERILQLERSTPHDEL